ncbi:MAG TPA: 2-C-methyl-D-erythritol 4-phosphate cytidylyltransferase, partial [Ktedonobacterales bacterium]|nr:2-C-methyl-D-erythritol 4-phosphate cytidylyltransferase [Ktedonobacterales bacterium]
RTRTVAAFSEHFRDILRRALDALAPDLAWIVIHDATRPLVTPEMIAAGLAAVHVPPAAPAPDVPSASRRPAPAVPPSVGAHRVRPPAAPAVVAAASIPVNETLKRVQNGLVVETPARSRLVLLQTPQVFSRLALLTALDTAPADLDPLDAASLAIAARLRVALFPGTPANIRVATPADLALAEALLNPR